MYVEVFFVNLRIFESKRIFLFYLKYINIFWVREKIMEISFGVREVYFSYLEDVFIW